ncbi:MAG: hypothetical protein ABJL67_13490 [Sulfitobacter sp.]
MANVKLEALMSIPKRGKRKALKRGETFEGSEQEARDFERMEQAKRLKTAVPVDRPVK